MSLLKCPECGNTVSEYSDHCLSCGCPVSKIKELLGISNSSKKDDTLLFFDRLPYQYKQLVGEICRTTEELNLKDFYKVNTKTQYGFRQHGNLFKSIIFRFRSYSYSSILDVVITNDKREEGAVYRKFAVSIVNLPRIEKAIREAFEHDMQ